MKSLLLVALLAFSGLALADDGEFSYGTEDVIAAGGLSAVAAGCADARSIQSGESTNDPHSRPCDPTQTSSRRYVKSDYFTIFKTHEEAEAHCNARDYVQSVVNFRLKVVGWSCAPNNSDNSGVI